MRRIGVGLVNESQSTGSYGVNRPLGFLRDVSGPVLVFALGIVLLEIPDHVLGSARGMWWATLLAWKLGPFGEFPIPFDFGVFAGTGFEYGSFTEMLPAMDGVLLLIGSTLTAIHFGIFVCTLSAYRRFGWPQYISDVDDRLIRRELWKKSVRRAWWVLPLLATIANSWSWFSYGQAYAQYRTVSVEWPFQIAILVLGAMTYATINARTIVAAVRAAVPVDGIRCQQCGYLLRGLAGPTCPECGIDYVPAASLRFELGRNYDRLRRWAVMIGFPLVGLMVVKMPVLQPTIVSMLPRRFVMRYVPGVLQPPAGAWSAIRASIPLKPGDICILRHNRALICIWLPLRKGPPTEARWWSWTTFDDWGRTPDKSGSVAISQTTYTGMIQVAGCPISILPAGWQYQWWVWITRFDPDWRAEVVLIGDAPEPLKKLAARETTK